VKAVTVNNFEDKIRQLEKAIDKALSYSQPINEFDRELELLKGRAGASQVTRNRHEAINCTTRQLQEL
jgi:hypothetical protein